jgi:hypothetical protein
LLRYARNDGAARFHLDRAAFYRQVASLAKTAHDRLCVSALSRASFFARPQPQERLNKLLVIETGQIVKPEAYDRLRGQLGSAKVMGRLSTGASAVSSREPFFGDGIVHLPGVAM